VNSFISALESGPADKSLAQLAAMWHSPTLKEFEKHSEIGTSIEGYQAGGQQAGLLEADSLLGAAWEDSIIDRTCSVLSGRGLEYAHQSLRFRSFMSTMDQQANGDLKLTWRLNE
jgi:hypothetical protein